MTGARQPWDEWRQKIIGLGEQSVRKSYYPELQKRLEELRASEADLRTLFDSVMDAIFICDGEGRVEDVNAAMLTMYGVTKEEALGLSIADYSAPGPQLGRLSGILTAAREGQSRMLFEWTALRPRDGTTFDVEVSLQATRWRGRAMVVAVVRDITARKLAEQKRRDLEQALTQARKMESVGRLAGGVAHDFNNMLQTILGSVDMALMGLPANSPLREDLEEIQEAAQRSAELTRQLLAFARKQTIKPRVISLNDSVSGALRMLRRLIGENVELAWLPGRDLWPVKLDPSQIEQVLANLTVNARDAISGTGRVTIETVNVTLDDTYASTNPECVPGDYVVLAVSDTGKGMDADVRAQVFEPFFTTKEVGHGTGLGLATVFGIVKQNAGLINVYSEPGRGATFKIYLPRAVGEGVATDTPAAVSSPRGTETVMLVEDEGQVLSLGRRILEQHGYTVIALATPQAALAFARQQRTPIHLLITDVVMPGLNGRELRDQLLSTHPGLRCLFISGYTANVIAHHGVVDEGIEFLQKPFTLQTLTRRVREVLDR